MSPLADDDRELLARVLRDRYDLITVYVLEDEGAAEFVRAAQQLDRIWEALGLPGTPEVQGSFLDRATEEVRRSIHVVT